MGITCVQGVQRGVAPLLQCACGGSGGQVNPNTVQYQRLMDFLGAPKKCVFYTTTPVPAHPNGGYNQCMNTPTNSAVTKAVEKAPEPPTMEDDDNSPASRLPVSPGRPAFDKGSLDEFKKLPLEKQKGKIRESWAEVAFILAARAKQFGKTVTKADFGRLQQLVTSAGIAVDKVITKGEVPMTTNVVFNLFGGIGAERMLKVVQPQVPVIDITPKEKQDE